MEAQEDKNKPSDTKEQIRALEQEMKSSFKEGNFDAIKAAADKLKVLDPENRLAEKLIKKAEIAKKKEDEKKNMHKAKEYIVMLKQLFKDKNAEKLAELAKEFKAFAPESKHADKWLFRAEKLTEKLGGEGKIMQHDIETKKPESKEEKKHGLFGSLFKKSEKSAEPEKKDGLMQMMAKKAKEEPIQMGPEKEKVEEKTEEPTKIETQSEPAKSASSMPVKPLETNTAPKIEMSTPVTPVAPVTPIVPVVEPKGNLFTKMFGKKDEVNNKKSIIDTIVAKTDKKKETKATEKEVESGQNEKKEGQLKMLTFSKLFMNFAIIFIVFSAAFLYVEWIDKENTLLGLAGISENTGKKLHSASEDLGTLKKQEDDLSKEIELFKGGYDDKAVNAVETIINNRINWPDIFAKINEVTNFVYELNDFFKYIEYNNYSFDAENGTIRVSGTLSDPLGRNLTKLVELEEAFKYYPTDRSDPDDTTKPFFIGFKEFQSFSKTLNKETGRYNSSFQLSFSLNK